MWHAGSCCGMQDLSVPACGLLSCSMQTLSCGMHAGSSFPVRDRTRPPCTGSTESYPLDHQGSPCLCYFFCNFLPFFFITSFFSFFHTLFLESLLLIKFSQCYISIHLLSYFKYPISLSYFLNVCMCVYIHTRIRIFMYI